MVIPNIIIVTKVLRIFRNFGDIFNLSSAHARRVESINSRQYNTYLSWYYCKIIPTTF